MGKRKEKSGSGAFEFPAVTGWDVALAALILTRFLVPTEAPEQGSTLWIATAWLGFAAARFWWDWKAGSICLPRPGLADASFAALAGGFCLSALLVLGGQGDKRAALNALWEWISLGVAWILLRGALSREGCRRLVCREVLVIAAVLAGLGVWQHFVWYPQQSRDMAALLELQSRIEQGQSLSPLEQREFQRLVSQLGTEVLTLDATGRSQLLARARFSVEPIGRFALANSFAVLLLVGLFLALDRFRQVLSAPQRGWRSWPIAGAILLISGCLLLTKSRTALAGAAAAVTWMVVRSVMSTGGISRQILRWAAAGMVCLTGLLILIWMTGGLDWQVLSEASKSLTYRFEYWQATWDVIREQPLLGVGPGNFRQHYLAYKLPGSSEEILDPHNLFLDAWANGGLLALLGLTVLCGLWLQRLFGRWPHADSQAGPLDLGMAPLAAGLVAMFLVIGEEWLLEGFLDWTLVVLGLAWIGASYLLDGKLSVGSASLLAVLAAATAVTVHLLGAGGLSMPAILQLLMLLWIMIKSPASLPRSALECSTGQQQGLLVAAAACVCLMAGCLWSALLPVLTVSQLLERGRYELIVGQKSTAAEQSFTAAAAADTLSAEPHHELAGLYFSRWSQSASDDPRWFEAAESQARQAIERDPFSAKRRLILGDWWLQRYQRTRDPNYAVTAVGVLQDAVPLYPNYAPLRAALALALEAAGRPATDEARLALRLDDRNRRQGHLDKVLPDSQRQRLEQIVQPAAPPD